jgi:hypothetical protein
MRTRLVSEEIKNLLYGDCIEEILCEEEIWQKEDNYIAKIIEEELGKLKYTDVEGTEKVLEKNWYIMLDNMRKKGRL